MPEGVNINDEADRMSDQATPVRITAPSIGAILNLLGEGHSPKEGGFEKGTSVDVAGGGVLVIQDVTKSSGMDVTTVVVTLLTTVTQAVVIEWFKTRLAARRVSSPNTASPPITVVVGDVQVSSS
jgi:hypothetical protein